MRHILLLTTGGTIACRDSGHGLAPALTAEDLLAAVPAVTRVCEVTARPLFNLDSTDMTPTPPSGMPTITTTASSSPTVPIPWPTPPPPCPAFSSTVRSPSC